VHRRPARPHQGQARQRSEMLSRSLPRLSNLKALFPPRPRDGWHQPGEIAAPVGSRARRRAHGGHRRPDPAGALVDRPRHGKNLSRHRSDAKASMSTSCGGSYRSCFRIMSTRKGAPSSVKSRSGWEVGSPHQRSIGTLHVNDVWKGGFAYVRLADARTAKIRPSLPAHRSLDAA
jgi:hypothetical protein